MDCKLESFEVTLCKGATTHKKVLNAGYMCQNCNAVSDDISTFIKETCPCNMEHSPAPASPSPAMSTPGHAEALGSPKPLSIKKRMGRIGGHFMEVHVRMANEAPSSKKAPEAPPALRLPIPSRSTADKVCKKTWEDAPTHCKDGNSALKAQLHEAQAELQRLLVLQALQAERKVLEELIMKKSMAAASANVSC